MEERCREQTGVAHLTGFDRLSLWPFLIVSTLLFHLLITSVTLLTDSTKSQSSILQAFEMAFFSLRNSRKELLMSMLDRTWKSSDMEADVLMKSAIDPSSS
ncbi:hypothetical protein KIN20_034011 [Parelaphostrongylus tenuis]|uniref:Uncharacterized protein n=1 Tax=Parelaphostrongylus tenuis TaxID=148309 RepID=A0AAD5WJQ3_PARTN|nr:hypothetical protein KIN20_034011 [Parelaphostrongylus tenuis]